MTNMILVLLTTIVLQAELIDMGPSPSDGSTSVTQIDHRLYRDVGRWLEQWDLAQSPPELTGRLLLEAPLVDLMNWDGYLLVYQQDGQLLVMLPDESIPTLVTDLAASPCTRFLGRLLRRDDLLVVPSPIMRVFDLREPAEPVQLAGDLWLGGHAACFVGDTLYTAAVDCCGDSCWDVAYFFDAIGFDAEGPFGLPFNPAWSPHVYPSGFAVDDSHVYVMDEWIWLRVFSRGESQAMLEYTQFQQYDKATPLLATGEGLLHANLDSLVLRRWQGNQLPVVHGRALEQVCDITREDTNPLIQAAERTWMLDSTAADSIVVLLDLPADGPVKAAAFSGSKLLVLQRQLQVYELPETPQELLQEQARVEVFGGERLAANAQLALVETPFAVLVLQIDEQPQVVGALSASPVRQLGLMEQTGLILTDEHLQVFDLSAPASPVESQLIDVAGLSDFAVQDSWCVLRGADSLHVYQLTAPGVLTQAGTARVASSFSLCDGLLVVPDHDGYNLTLTGYALPDLSTPVLTQQLPGVEPWYRLHSGSGRMGLWMSPYNPIWPGDPYEFRLFDLMEGSGFQQTAALETGWKREILALGRESANAGWFVVHEEGHGLRLFRDDSTLDVSPPASVTLLPSGFALSAAPNPFNPVTRISFQLQSPGVVSLRLFDLAGREVLQLMKDTLPAGKHVSRLDGGPLSSGVYLLQLDVDGAREVRKLALVK